MSKQRHSPTALGWARALDPKVPTLRDAVHGMDLLMGQFARLGDAARADLEARAIGEQGQPADYRRRRVATEEARVVAHEAVERALGAIEALSVELTDRLGDLGPALALWTWMETESGGGW